MKKQTGLSLVELVISMAILGIMASIAVPSFSSWVRQNQQSSIYNTLAGTISLARLEAIKRSSIIALCTSTDQSTCASNGDWHDGWLVYVDVNGNRTLDTTNVFDSDGDGVGDSPEPVLRRQKAAATGLSITSSQYPSLLTIAPRGRLHKQGTFVICDGDDEESAMALNLWVTGLGRIAKDSNNDDIVENISNTNVACP